MLVPAGPLDDLLENIRTAARLLATSDPKLADALSAAAAEVRTRAVLEP